MTHKTNHLLSHSGESRAHPANRLVPRATVRTCTLAQRKILSHRHNKRVRRYYAKLIQTELGL